MSELRDAIYRLSQDEGLFDHEIAELLGYHRTSITRYRRSFQIPHANIINRKDKKQTCRRCGEESLIRRKQRRRKYCPTCRRIVWEERQLSKRLYMRNKTKKHSEGMLINP